MKNDEYAINDDQQSESLERQKKYQAIAEIAALLHSHLSAEKLCESICKIVNKALRYPELTMVKMRLGECLRSTSENTETPWKIIKSFTTPDSLSGSIEIYYSSEKHWIEASNYLKEYRSFLDRIAILISGSISREDLELILLENIERNKELSGLDRVNQIIKRNDSVEVLLQEICHALPASWQYPNSTCIRLTYGTDVYTSDNFKLSPWVQKQTFRVPGGAEGCLEVYYTSEFPEEDEGPFLKEERSLLNIIAQLLSIAIGCKIHEQLIYENRERLKELMAINRTTDLIMKGKPIDDTLQSICDILPDSWQFPEHAAAKIIFEGREYVSRPFTETPYVQREQFVTFDNQSGTVEIYYLTKLPDYAEGPFLKEERNLLFNIARLIAHYINNEKGRRILKSITVRQAIASKKEASLPENDLFSENDRTLKANYVVKNILVVSSVQDAYLLAAESYNSSQFKDPYHNNIWSPPQFTFSSSVDDAVIRLDNQHFDIVFIIAFSPFHDIIKIYKPLKSKHPDTQFFLITKSPEQISVLQTVLLKEGHFKTSLFSYEDHPEFLTVLCKLYEDSMNCDQVMAPTILLVDDSPEYYTPVILDFYSTVFNQLRNKSTSGRKTGHTRMRMLLTCNYEDSVHIALLHSKSLVAVFSDIEFRKNGVLHSNAGFDLYDIINEYSENIKFILHSTEQSFEEKARLNKNIEYLYKGSPLFYRSLCEHIDRMHHFDLECESECKQSFYNLGSFLKFMPKLSPTQITDLAKNSSFLNWLKVQGLFDCVTQITSTDYSSLTDEESSECICNLLNNAVEKEIYPPIVHYSAEESLSEKVITTVSTGSLGGKGRNIAFLHSLTSLKSLGSSVSSIQTRVPLTLIIRSDEYERILQDERILEVIKGTDFKAIQRAFDAIELSDETLETLKRFVEMIDTPLAVRSSSLFEDSIYRPFAGSFETYIIPNSHPEPTERLRQLLSAIKRVYASPFKPETQLYFSHTGKKAEEDRMAIVLQELVGERHGAYYYPQISGVAGSYNFYPVGHMKAEDGFAVIAFGLGIFVVEGRGGHRFSPVYPDIEFGSVKDLIRGSQTKFYAVNLKKESLDFDRYGEKAGVDLLDIETAESHGTLNHCASVYDYANDRITPDLRLPGPRIVDFADILKYDYLPLAQTISSVIQKLSSSMGTPVEIEFAINNCNTQKFSPVFYLLQVRPLGGEQLGHNINIKSANPQECILYSQTSLGNGKIDTLTDVIVIKTENFDPTRTDEMVNEVDYFNRLQVANKRNYIIIGPGRWGTRDKSLGIPVAWSQICNAKIVVEIAMNNFPLDASLGSHFFHNITVMKIGYIAITNTRKDEFINWDAFNSMECVENLKYFKLLRSKTPLSVQLDGRNKQALITRE